MEYAAIAAIVAAIIGAGAQWFNSEEAKKASAKEREEMKKLLETIQNPTFDATSIPAEQFKVLEKYKPEVADFVKEQNPQIVTGKTEGARIGREAQLSALQKLRGLSETGDDIQSKAQTQAALDAAAAQAQGQRASILQQMAARGALTSGGTLASQLQAQQGANQLAQQGTLQSAAEAERRRLQAIRESAGLGSQIRGEDINLEAQNAAIINDFNRRTASRQQDYGQYRAGTLNDAQLKNMGEAQRIAEMNEQSRYKHAIGERDVANKLKQQGYTNILNKYDKRSDIGNMARSDIGATEQSRARAIGGVSEGVTAGLAYGSQPKKKESQPALVPTATTSDLDDKYTKKNQFGETEYGYMNS